MGPFEEILYQLGQKLDLNLYVDDNGVCELVGRHDVHVQLFYEHAPMVLTLASSIVEVPPGKYREILFLQALQSNASNYHMATLAYSSPNNMLVAFKNFMHPLDCEDLVGSMEVFIEFVHQWREAVLQGAPLPTGSFSR